MNFEYKSRTLIYFIFTLTFMRCFEYFTFSHALYTFLISYMYLLSEKRLIIKLMFTCIYSLHHIYNTKGYIKLFNLDKQGVSSSVYLFNYIIIITITKYHAYYACGILRGKHSFSIISKYFRGIIFHYVILYIYTLLLFIVYSVLFMVIYHVQTYIIKIVQVLLFKQTSIIDTRKSDCSYFIVKQIITINYIRQALHDLVHLQLLLYRLIGLLNCFNIRRRAYNIHFLHNTHPMNLYININSHWCFFLYKLYLSQFIRIYILIYICVMIMLLLDNQNMCVYFISIVIVCVLIIRKPLLLYVTLIRRANKVTFLPYLIHIPDRMSHALITLQWQGKLTDIIAIISIPSKFLIIYFENRLCTIILYYIYFCWSRKILFVFYQSVLIVDNRSFCSNSLPIWICYFANYRTSDYSDEQYIIYGTIILNKYTVFIYCMLYVHVCIICLVSSLFKAQYYHRLIGYG